MSFRNWLTKSDAAELKRLRQRERGCDAICGAMQSVAHSWYQAEKEFDLDDDGPYEAIKRLMEAANVKST